MKFNYIKGFISSALFCVLCVNAKEQQISCSSLKDVKFRCKENQNGEVTYLSLKNDITLEKGFIAGLTSIKSLHFNRLNGGLKQYHIDEISTLTNLENLSLNHYDESEGDEKIDLTVLKNLEDLSTLHVNDFNSEFSIKGLKNLKELHLYYSNITPSLLNDIGEFEKIDELLIYLNEKNKNIDFEPLKNNKNISFIVFGGDTENKYTFEKNAFKGFNNLKELYFLNINFNQDNIDEISGLTELEDLTFHICDFENVDIEPLNQLSNLKSIEIRFCETLKGKTLTNNKLENCYYGAGSDLCITKDMDCLNEEAKSAFKPCESEVKYNCDSFKNIAFDCEEDQNGNVKYLDFGGNAKVEKGVLSKLTSLKKIMIENSLEQYHFDEIATLPNLEEIFIRGHENKIDINVLRNLKSLKDLKIMFYNELNFKGFNNLKKLSLSECDITQTIINDIAELEQLENLEIEIDNETKKLDFNPLRNKKNLNRIHIRGENEKYEHYKVLIKDTLKGFNYIKNLSLEGIDLKQEDINDISGLTQLEGLKFHLCDFNDLDIESFNKLSNLKSIEFEFCSSVKGKTLTNDKLEKCVYEDDMELCIAKDMKCLTKEIKSAFKPCDNVSTTTTTATTTTTTTTKSSYPTSTDDRCGKNYGTRCPSGECCSKHGWCGKTKDHCGSGCQSEFGDCDGNSTTTTTTRKTTTTTTTKTKTTTRKTTTTTTTKSSYPTSTNDRCGKNFGTRCPSGKCCSKHGWCGKSSDYCGSGCQSEFGKCN